MYLKILLILLTSLSFQANAQEKKELPKLKVNKKMALVVKQLQMIKETIQDQNTNSKKIITQ